MPEFNSGGASYFWREHGVGDQPAHFIHCSLASSRAWLPMMAEFEQELSSTAIDMPGHGRTEMPVAGVDLQVQAANASIALIEQADGPVHLIGHSYGGTVALRIAVERPDLVRSLVLVEPVFFAILDDAGNPEYARLMEVEHSFGKYLETGDLPRATEAFVGVWGVRNEWQNMPDERRQKITSRIWFISMQADSIIHRNAVRISLQDVKKIQVPTLLMRGSESPEIVHHINDTLCSAMQNAQQTVVKGAGHMVPLTHHDQASTIFRGFWGL